MGQEREINTEKRSLFSCLYTSSPGSVRKVRKKVCWDSWNYSSQRAVRKKGAKAWWTRENSASAQHSCTWECCERSWGQG